MPNLNYAEKMDEITVMLDGLKANTERLAKRGASREFIDQFIAAYDLVRQLNSEQETLKALQKEKTATLETEYKKLENLAAEARKMIKLEMPQERWKEFGIKASR